jgi:uncharacterized protein (TIGR02271 family)
MDSSAQDWVLNNGLDVIGSDGEKLGEVQDALGEYFVVKKGFFFPTEYYIPSSAITNVDDRAVYLNVTKDEALNQGWDQVPVTTQVPGLAATDVAAGEAVVDRAPTTDTGLRDEGQSFDHAATVGTQHLDETDTIRVPLSEEELTATKRTVDRGAVRVEKDVVAEEQALDVPVTEEQVHVTQRVVDRDIAPGETVFEEGTIEVPVRGEEVVTEKRARVTGEVEIAKDAVQHTERVSDTVRREEAHVVDETGAVVDDTGVVTDDDRPLR